MTRVIRAEDLGLVGNDAETFDAFQTSEGVFPLGKQLGIWEQWVSELESGFPLLPEELEAACSARDAVDDSCAVLPERLAPAVFDFVDRLDRTFRDWTVSSPSSDQRPERWWRGRVPLRTGQRMYLFNVRAV